jgi:alpha-beta hydrolase superfamily lysophospholipase
MDEIRNRYGERLKWIIHRTTSLDLVIVAHGFASTKENALIVSVCDAIQGIGVNALRFDFSGYGESEGKPEDSSFIKRSEDLNSVVSHFKARGYRIRSVISHSAGATAAIIGAAADRRIESLILIAPRIQLSNSIIAKAISAHGKTISDIIETPDTVYPYQVEIKGQKESEVFYFSRDYLIELRDLDIPAFLQKIEVPVLILLGTEDYKIQKEEVQQACNVNSLVYLEYIEGAGHSFRNEEHRSRLIAQIVNWYKSLFKS